jgi:hypothetical protein
MAIAAEHFETLKRMARVYRASEVRNNLNINYPRDMLETGWMVVEALDAAVAALRGEVVMDGLEKKFVGHSWSDDTVLRPRNPFYREEER